MTAPFAVTALLSALAALLAAFAAVERGLISIIINGRRLSPLLKKH
jgi:hypothetical protein